MENRKTNTPYVKKFDENGFLLNEIDKSYVNNFNNRKTRRSLIQKDRFKGNSSGISLTVISSSKYERVVQEVLDNTSGLIKRIQHYILK